MKAGRGLSLKQKPSANLGFFKRQRPNCLQAPICSFIITPTCASSVLPPPPSPRQNPRSNLFEIAVAQVNYRCCSFTSSPILVWRPKWMRCKNTQPVTYASPNIRLHELQKEKVLLSTKEHRNRRTHDAFTGGNSQARYCPACPTSGSTVFSTAWIFFLILLQWRRSRFQ